MNQALAAETILLVFSHEHFVVDQVYAVSLIASRKACFMGFLFLFYEAQVAVPVKNKPPPACATRVLKQTNPPC